MTITTVRKPIGSYYILPIAPVRELMVEFLLGDKINSFRVENLDGCWIGYAQASWYSDTMQRFGEHWFNPITNRIVGTFQSWFGLVGSGDLLMRNLPPDAPGNKLALMVLCDLLGVEEVTLSPSPLPNWRVVLPALSLLAWRAAYRQTHTTVGNIEGAEIVSAPATE